MDKLEFIKLFQAKAPGPVYTINVFIDQTE